VRRTVSDVLSSAELPARVNSEEIENFKEMSEQRKIYPKYRYNRGLATLWKGDPNVAGSAYRSVRVTSDSHSAGNAIFQILAVEGVGSDDTRVLHDADESDVFAAVLKFNQLVREAESEGFSRAHSGDDLGSKGKH
jgi:hypothetical protein